MGRVGYLQGLPYNETTDVSIEAGSNALWIGTARGAARWDRQQGTWNYYYLQRYLPGLSQVISLSCGSTFTAVATDGGISLLEVRFWTLEQKAAWYDTILLRHNRAGSTRS